MLLQAILDAPLKLFRSSEHRGVRFVRGSAILFLGRFAIKGVYFVKTLVVARLLFPEDIGLFAMASVGLAFVDIFFQSGFGSAIIQKAGHTREEMDTAWTIQLIRNVVLALVIVLVAPYLADFFGEPRLVLLMRFLSLAMVIVALENIGIILLMKDMRFNRKFAFDLSFIVCEVVITVVAAFFLRNVYALLIGTIGSRLCAMVLSYAFHPYRPRFYIDGPAARRLFGYGKWVGLLTIVSYAVSQGDTITVGKLLGPENLGYYQSAFALALLPVAEFARVLGTALFPAFAGIQNDPEHLRHSFRKSAQLVFAFTIPACLGIYATAPWFVPVVYGAKWLPMIPILSILVFYALVKTIDGVSAPFFLGIGRPRLSATSMGIQCVAMLALIVPLTRMWGVEGAAWAVFISGVVSQCYVLCVLVSRIALGFADAWRIVGLAGMAGVSMLVLVRFVGDIFVPRHVAGVLGLMLLGAVTYAAILFVLDRLFGNSFRTSISWVVERF